MPALSPARAGVPILPVLQLVHRGKVRDTYALESDNLLVVATDGISIFDFVLNALVPNKGRVLNMMSHFWFTMLEAHGIKTHMVVAGTAIDRYLPAHLRGNADLQKRAMVVHKLDMRIVEMIFRFCLTGSVLQEYQKSGGVYGIRSQPRLQDGDALVRPLFTPTTKEDGDHDQPLSPSEVEARYPKEVELVRAAFEIIREYAQKKHVMIADGKSEVGIDEHGVIRIGDEFGTPDSSRIWDLNDWKESRNEVHRKAPQAYDKQYVRNWGIELGINKRKPSNPDDVRWVHGLVVPVRTIEHTTRIYEHIFQRITGRSLEMYALKCLD